MDNELKKHLYIKNLETISDIYQNVLSLKEYWREDRQVFFKELGLLIVTNTAAEEVEIIFNDLSEALSNTHPKTSDLVQKVLCYRQEQWSMKELSPSHQKLLETYKDQLLKQPPRIVEIQEQGFTLVGQIQKSPFLAMVKCPRFNSLQQAIILGITMPLESILT